MRTTLGILLIALAPAVSGAQTLQRPHALMDPAVLRFTEFVQERIKPPLSDVVVVSGLDQLLSALEGVTIAQALGDSILDRAHVLRGEARQLYPGAPSADRTARRQKLLEDTAALVAQLNKALPPESRMTKARVEALERAARGLEIRSPLPEQPDSLERFFRHAAEALQVAQP